jgi:serine/threonine-protein kinase PknK
VERLDAGAAVAEQLGLPRLAAAVTNERIRLGMAIAPPIADRLWAPRPMPSGDGIALITAELDEGSGIRLLSRSDSTGDREQACRRARELCAGIDPERRPFSALTAQLLLAETLTATGDSAEADAASRGPVGWCMERGLNRLVVDAGLG